MSSLVIVMSSVSRDIGTATSVNRPWSHKHSNISQQTLESQIQQHQSTDPGVTNTATSVNRPWSHKHSNTSQHNINFNEFKTLLSMGQERLIEQQRIAISSDTFLMNERFE